MSKVDRKSSSTELEIIFDDTNSSTKFNQELINYFKNNLDGLNRSGVKFIWRIATKDEYPLYKERGIKHYPAVIVPPKTTKYGVKDIIREINNYINQRKKMSGTAASLTNGMSDVSDEALYEYQRHAIGNAGDDDTDPRDGFDANFRRRQVEMERRRKAAGMESPNNDNNQGNMADLDIGMGDDDKYNVKLPQGGRPDNLNPMRIDPSDSLQRLRRQGGGAEVAQDIDLMQMHLDKMGGDGMSSIDYY
jgi:hypothetical protein